MKIKAEFILKQIAGENVVIFLTPEFSNKVVTLNETGALLFNLLKDGAEVPQLVDALLSEYEVTPEAAKRDVDAFISSLTEFGALS